MIYLHTSALVRVAGLDDDPLPALLSETEDGIAVSSELSKVELTSPPLPSAVLRRARAVLDSPAVVTVEVSDLMRESADSLTDGGMEESQAVHLATALSLGAAVTVFACDDPEVAAAAAARGIRAAVPPFGTDRAKPQYAHNCENRC
ncbi:hypothetical protein [Umezawaea tangerina]|uniref:PIN domain-containing protein n=1 Tax=Umezawaea tangerina TaxID=84725 RepID=A0A2T0TG46_9PSEU|nr:hypothetical protein [Umezawaea tangerina]PRY44634.1 hypothetical protein CLV43_102199 [Umezawaea tangerina]